ncbi:SAM-dependent methyltransferase [Alloactinosynnema sp. L-07]|uniref:SAM-dependent methyltransferase n=1 Tax=Alloactinosynnema sp. L-07 TaxID=1653480 RepID=UPI000834ACC0|nr:SAM-dependent methyltransferase [Alloactinosynnema sp. L-07]
MSEWQGWVPSSVDVSVPSIARAYDYLLGGAHNFEADRELSRKAEQMLPGLRQLVRMNRAFLGRAVRFMISQGVRQFLDVGAGIPTVGSVHQVAHGEDPTCRVVYVDRDPVAVAHSELMLADQDQVAIVRADIRDPEGIFDSPEARRLLDLDEPVGVLMLFMLHWVPDDWDPIGLLAKYNERLAPGSMLAITHASADRKTEEITKVAGLVEQSKSRDLVQLRSHAEIEPLFAGFELVEPGLVGCGLWRPSGAGDIAGEADMNSQFYAGVGRKI